MRTTALLWGLVAALDVCGLGSTLSTGQRAHGICHSPNCLMPSLSSISSWTLGMSMCNRGPWGGPFTGVSKLRLFLLWGEGLQVGDSAAVRGRGRVFCKNSGDWSLSPAVGKREERREEATIWNPPYQHLCQTLCICKIVERGVGWEWSLSRMRIWGGMWENSLTGTKAGLLGRRGRNVRTSRTV